MENGAQKRILCVNHFEDNCELFSFVLSEVGYKLQTARSMAEGLRQAQNSRFTLYLIDLTLTDGNGFELINKIRHFDRSTPIIMSSGDGRRSIRETASQLCVQAFLTLPIDINQLTSTIDRLLQATV